MGQMKSRRDWNEARRFRAYQLKNRNWKQRDIAEALGVQEWTVSRWLRRAREQGKRSLRARIRPGAPRRLTDDQIEQIPKLLWHGAEAYGFLGNVWTCARVRKIIELEFGVSYHKAHVSRILKELDWTPQKPIVRASQRDEDEILRWGSQVWPDIKKSEKVQKNPSFRG